jgi:hypothetical protein
MRRLLLLGLFGLFCLIATGACNKEEPAVNQQDKQPRRARVPGGGAPDAKPSP